MSLKYEKGEPAEWRDGIENLQLEVRQAPGSGNNRTYDIVGPCPRCKHQLRKNIDYIVGPALALSSLEELVVRVVCNCTSAHEGAPEGTSGCGAEGAIKLEYT